MISVPTSMALHFPFNVAAWAAGMGLAQAVGRWRPEVVAKAPVEAGYYGALAGGAILGAWLSGSTNMLLSAVPSLSHSVAGALAGGIVAVELYKFLKGMRRSTGGRFVGALAIGIAVGRWGCLFAGLPDETYGIPTMLPWGVDLGDHVSRHPVQIYESLSMAAFLAMYLVALGRRQPWAVRRGFYVFCAWYGAQRFCWEFLKPYPKIVGPFNLFHILCFGLVVYGVSFFIRDRTDERGGDQHAGDGAGSGTVFVSGADDQPLRDLS